MAGPRSIVLLIFTLLALSGASDDKGTSDGRSSFSDSWQSKLKKAIGGLGAAPGVETGLFGERQAYQDAQRHYQQRPTHMMPMMPNANKRRPAYRSNHPPRPAPPMLFGGFQPMRPRHPKLGMPMPTVHNQQLNQQRGPHNQPYGQQQQQPPKPPQQQHEHSANQQVSPKIRTLAGRPEQPHPQQSVQQSVQQSQHQQYHQPYPIEPIDLPPPPVPPPSLAQQELLKLQFTGEEYLTYLYLNPPVIKEPDQDIQAAQSAPDQVTHEKRHEQRLQPVVSPSVAIYDPYRYNSVHSLMHGWEKRDKQSVDDDWVPIHSPWGNESPINNTSNASS